MLRMKMTLASSYIRLVTYNVICNRASSLGATQNIHPGQIISERA
jgi:hypothetical protein